MWLCELVRECTDEEARVADVLERSGSGWNGMRGMVMLGLERPAVLAVLDKLPPVGFGAMVPVEGDRSLA